VTDFEESREGRKEVVEGDNRRLSNSHMAVYTANGDYKK
jgi:hypothetical protein